MIYNIVAGRKKATSGCIVVYGNIAHGSMLRLLCAQGNAFFSAPVNVMEITIFYNAVVGTS